VRNEKTEGVRPAASTWEGKSTGGLGVVCTKGVSIPEARITNGIREQPIGESYARNLRSRYNLGIYREKEHQSAMSKFGSLRLTLRRAERIKNVRGRGKDWRENYYNVVAGEKVTGLGEHKIACSGTCGSPNFSSTGPF